MIVKTCIKHGDLTEDQCKKVIEKRWGVQPNYKYKCRECIVLYNKKYLHNPDKEHQERVKTLRKKQIIKHHKKLLESRRKNAKANREKLNLQARKLREKNLEKHREVGRKIQHKWREDLHDNYVKTQFKRRYGLKASEVPDWMVLVKKEVIKLRRKIREIKSGN